jgi:hypothetical protein
MVSSASGLMDVSIGLSPLSRIHGIAQNGYMMIPGRFNSNLPESSTSFLVVDFLDPQAYCEEGSLIYLSLIERWYEVFARVVISPNELVETLVSSSPQIAAPILSYQISTRNIFMTLPDNLFQELFQYILPDHTGENFPLTIDDCDLATGRPNSNYPSLHVQLMSTDTSGSVHVGTIILGPDDYMDVVDENQCRLRIKSGPFPSFGTPFLSKIAVHFKSDTIGFCDPILPQ